MSKRYALVLEFDKFSKEDQNQTFKMKKDILISRPYERSLFLKVTILHIEMIQSRLQSNLHINHHAHNFHFKIKLRFLIIPSKK